MEEERLGRWGFEMRLWVRGVRSQSHAAPRLMAATEDPGDDNCRACERVPQRQASNGCVYMQPEIGVVVNRRATVYSMPSSYLYSLRSRVEP